MNIHGILSSIRQTILVLLLQFWQPTFWHSIYSCICHIAILYVGTHSGLGTVILNLARVIYMVEKLIWGLRFSDWWKEKKISSSSKQVRQIIPGMNNNISQKEHRDLLRSLKSSNLTRKNYSAANSTSFTPFHSIEWVVSLQELGYLLCNSIKYKCFLLLESSLYHLTIKVTAECFIHIPSYCYFKIFYLL